MSNAINPFYASRIVRAVPPQPVEAAIVTYARLPQAPITGSPVPHLTSLYHFDRAGEYGDRKYPGNCGGNLIKDLLTFFQANTVYDPLTGSGTCRDVCKELGIYCRSSDLHQGVDACGPSPFHDAFDLCWMHPPYWRQKVYSRDARDLSRAPTLKAFLERYELLLRHGAEAVRPGGKLVVLIGDYTDRFEGFVPLVYWTKRIAFQIGLRQSCTDIVRFSHGASSGKKVYRSIFIPGLHDIVCIFNKPN